MTEMAGWVSPKYAIYMASKREFRSLDSNLYNRSKEQTKMQV